MRYREKHQHSSALDYVREWDWTWDREALGIKVFCITIYTVSVAPLHILKIFKRKFKQLNNLHQKSQMYYFPFWSVCAFITCNFLPEILLLLIICAKSASPSKHRLNTSFYTKSSPNVTRQKLSLSLKPHHALSLFHPPVFKSFCTGIFCQCKTSRNLVFGHSLQYIS